MSCIPAKTKPQAITVSDEKTESVSPKPKTKKPEKAPPAVIVIPEKQEEVPFDTRFGDGLVTIEFEQLHDEKITETERDSVYDPDFHGPISGGKAKIYLFREFLDDAVADLIRLYPFGIDGQERKIFTVTDSTHRRLELKLTGRIMRGNDRRATALDFIELWSRFIKSRPAQGLALFQNVQDAENFVKGTAPIVNGFSAADENTIRIRFDKPDPLAFHRLNSSKLIGGPFLLGIYYSTGTAGAKTRLLPNANNLLPDTAYLAECIVQMGGDPDPLMSFSTGQYAAMTVYLAADLEIVKNELVAGGKATLKKLPSDRYFLSCKAEDNQVCRFVYNTVDGANMLKNTVKAEGEEIRCITAQSQSIDFPPKSRIPVPQLEKPFRIIYRSDDPTSKLVAEKLYADLTNASLNTTIAGQTAEAYETALVKGTFDCAIGWVSEAVLENQTEQLHLASMWFFGETNSQVRIRENREIPLFSINNYLLLQNNTKLHQNKISGIWIFEDAGQGTAE
jgi:hypothetical protein